VTLSAKFEALEREKNKLFGDLKSAEENLVEATTAHDQVVSEKVQMKLNDMKDYVLTVHSQSFQQVVRQAVLLYGAQEENEIGENKDVYNGQLVSIEEIPTPSAH